MSDHYFPEADKPKEKRRLSKKRILARVLIAAAIVVSISLWALSMLGGNSSALREGLEAHISQVSGHDVRIGALNRVDFFPNLRVNMDNVLFYAVDDVAGLRNAGRLRSSSADVGSVQSAPMGSAVAGVGHLHVALSFYDLVTSRPHYRVFDISGVWFDPEFTGYKRIEFSRIGVDEDAHGEHFLTATGTYGGEDVLVRVGVEKRGTESSPIWAVPMEMPFFITVGPVTFNGVSNHGTFGGSHIRVDHLGVDGGAAWTGELRVNRRGPATVLKGELVHGDMRIMPDVALKVVDGRLGVHGNIGIENENVEFIAPLYRAIAERMRPVDSDMYVRNLEFWNVAGVDVTLNDKTPISQSQLFSEIMTEEKK